MTNLVYKSTKVLNGVARRVIGKEKYICSNFDRLKLVLLVVQIYVIYHILKRSLCKKNTARDKKRLYIEGYIESATKRHGCKKSDKIT